VFLAAENFRKEEREERKMKKREKELLKKMN